MAGIKVGIPPRPPQKAHTLSRVSICAVVYIKSPKRLTPSFNKVLGPQDQLVLGKATTAHWCRPSSLGKGCESHEPTANCQVHAASQSLPLPKSSIQGSVVG